MSFSNSIKCFRKQFFFPPFSVQRSLINEDAVARAFTDDRKWRFGWFHARSLHHQLRRRVRDSGEISSFLLRRRCVSSPSRRCLSTTNSSGSRAGGGFLRWYLAKLDSHPFITKSITTSLIFAAADLTSQMITLPPSGSFDLIRTSRMASYGLLLLGPSQHLWFNYLSKILPKRDVGTTLKKIFMGQVIYGPCSNTVFFSFNASLQGESRDEIVARLKRDLLPTMRNGLMYWPLCDFVTFKFVPVHLQPLVNSSCAYLWTIYLTYVASLKKVSAEE